ncbi:interferon-induced protein 44-like [Tachysurus vachellii]|uniref:interferon-induced protein 44-like n=1 Tax=Tachysurus vachellii TaxID=175792 RepID=UPI00296B525E|nr:interferon-induced protein 44-like [Tachysurus vachellii]
MGSVFSGEEDVFPTEQRRVKWSEREPMLRTLRGFQSNENVEHLRILCVGPAGSGTSAFITSVTTALKACSTYHTPSLTGGSVKYAIYKLNKGTEGSFFPFVFGHTVGLEKGSAGIHTEDIISILNSHIQEGNKNKDPTANNALILNDQFHCLVFIVPADIISKMPGEINKMKQILQKAPSIPKVVIMTKVDVACPHVKLDLKKIYRSKKIWETMQTCHELLGIPLKNIFPVKNYHEEIDNNNEIDVLILTAVTNIVKFANDFVIASGKPWRHVNWSERERMLQTLREFRSNQSVEHLRILFVGPAGSGKSAFITSVNTALQGRSTYLAHSLTGCKSVTSKYTVYKLNKGTEGSFFPFVLGDTMGLEETSGARTKDIISILNGHMQEGYTFNPQKDLIAESNDYNSTPHLNDKVHCLVYVISADTMAQIPDELTNKLCLILKGAHESAIPVVVIMTKVDAACPHVKENVKMIYRSKMIREQMQKCNVLLGIPLKYIFPVKNYHEEIDNNNEIDVLILTAITNIVNFANDFVKGKV